MNLSILIIDKDQTSNEHLRGLLHPHYDVTVSPTVREAREQLKQMKFNLVLGDFEIFAEVEHNFPQEVRNLQPKAKLALISRLDTEHYLPYLTKWRCFNVLPKLPFYNARKVLLFLENILDPFVAFGLDRYLAPDAEIRNLQITGRDQKNHILENIINFFADFEYEIHELYDIRLIIEEGINNAIFHAFVDEKGIPKYTAKNFQSLEPSEEVRIAYGADATTIGFSITDNRGILTPKTIIDKMARQYFREGLFDENGRGLYLARQIAGNILFNIEKSKRTQIVSLFYEKRINIPKPFCINYILDPSG